VGSTAYSSAIAGSAKTASITKNNPAVKGVTLNGSGAATAAYYVNSSDTLGAHVYEAFANLSSSASNTIFTADATTVFMIQGGDGTTVPYTYTTVTGIDKIGNFSDVDLFWVDADNNGRADYVYVIGGATAATDTGLFYLTDTGVTADLTNSTFTLNGYLNGTLTTLTFAVNLGTDRDGNYVNDEIDTLTGKGAGTLWAVSLSNGVVTSFTASGADVDTSGKSPVTSTAGETYYGYSAIKMSGTADYSKSVLKDNNGNKFYITGDTVVYGNDGSDLKAAYTLGTGDDEYSINVVYNTSTNVAKEVYVWKNSTASGNTGTVVTYKLTRANNIEVTLNSKDVGTITTGYKSLSDAVSNATTLSLTSFPNNAVSGVTTIGVTKNGTGSSAYHSVTVYGNTTLVPSSIATLGASDAAAKTPALVKGNVIVVTVLDSNVDSGNYYVAFVIGD
jgi:hypothetical protein